SVVGRRRARPQVELRLRVGEGRARWVRAGPRRLTPGQRGAGDGGEARVRPHEDDRGTRGGAALDRRRRRGRGDGRGPTPERAHGVEPGAASVRDVGAAAFTTGGVQAARYLSPGRPRALRPAGPVSEAHHQGNEGGESEPDL